MRYAELLDGYGYDHIKVGDHTLSSDPNTPYPNSQVVLAAVGARTKGARLSTAVTDPFRRHPVEIAQWIADFSRRNGIWSITMAQLNQEDNTRGGEGIRLAFVMAATTLAGFESMTALGEEASDARKTIPRTMLTPSNCSRDWPEANSPSMIGIGFNALVFDRNMMNLRLLG